MAAEAKSKQRKHSPRKRVDFPSANGSRGPRTSKRTELANEVASELESLRSALDEMTEHYRLRVAAQIGELMQTVRGNAASGEKPTLPPARTLQPMLQHLRSANLKPRKGRPKDFRRVEKLLDELVALTPPD